MNAWFVSVAAIICSSRCDVHVFWLVSQPYAVSDRTVVWFVSQPYAVTGLLSGLCLSHPRQEVWCQCRVSSAGDATSIMSQQKYACCDKHNFASINYFCRYKRQIVIVTKVGPTFVSLAGAATSIIFVATKVLLLQTCARNTSFVATKYACRDKHDFVATKLGRQKCVVWRAVTKKTHAIRIVIALSGTRYAGESDWNGKRAFSGCRPKH